MIAPPNKGSAVADVLINNPLLKGFFGPAGQELKDGEYIDKICAVPESGFMIIAGTKSVDIKNPTSWLTKKISWKNLTTGQFLLTKLNFQGWTDLLLLMIRIPLS